MSVEPLILKTDKGFERVVVDLAGSQPVIQVGTTADVVTGKLLSYVGGVLTLEKEVDRFEKHAVYIPLSSVVFIAAGKTV